METCQLHACQYLCVSLKHEVLNTLMTDFTPNYGCENCFECYKHARHGSQPNVYSYMYLQLLHVLYTLFGNILPGIQTHVCAPAGQHCQAAEEHTGR